MYDMYVLVCRLKCLIYMYNYVKTMYVPTWISTYFAFNIFLCFIVYTKFKYVYDFVQMLSLKKDL